MNQMNTWSSEQWQAFAQLMRERGLRVTAKTTAIARVLAASTQALSHADVLARLERTAVDRVTVYRVLDRLAQLGLAKRWVGADGAARYSAIPPDARDTPAKPSAATTPQSMFECDSCHTIEPLPTNPALQKRLKLLAQGNAPTGAQNVAPALVLRGRCAHCSRS
jgi:Fur family transcriptional regulator, ferric uptake regulator